MGKFCSNCGNAMKPESKFCSVCGAPAVPDAQPQSPTVQSAVPAAQPNQPTYRYAVPNQDKQNGYPQQQYPQQSSAAQPQVYQNTQPQYPPQYQAQYSQPAYQPQPVKKKSPALRVIAVVLIVAILAGIGVTGFVYPGFFLPKKTYYQAEILLPEMTEEEVILQNVSAMTFAYYMAARGAFDLACNIDPATATEQEMIDGGKYLQKSAELYETAEKLTAAMEKAADAYDSSAKAAAPSVISANESRISPVIGLSNADQLLGRPNAITHPPVKAQTALEWANEITHMYDYEYGMSYRKLAKALGTDVKRAIAIVKQANNLIEGGAETNVSETYTKAINRAKVARAAGAVSVACLGGYALAAGGSVAAGVGAATGTGAKVFAAVKGVSAVGAVACSGCNAVIDVTDAAVSITVGDENNEYIDAVEQTRSDFAPVATTFAVLKVATSLPDLIKLTNNIRLNGWGADTNAQDLNKTKMFLGINGLKGVGEKTFGWAKSLFGSDSKTLTGVKTENTPGGTKVTVSTTELSADEKNRENINRLLDDTGCSSDMKDDVDKALDAIAADPNGEDPYTGAGTDEYIPMPDEFCHDYLQEVYYVDRDGFDIDDYIKDIISILMEIAAMMDETEEPTEAPTEEPTEEPTEAPTVSEPTALDMSGDDREVMEKVAGTYLGKGTWYDLEKGTSETDEDLYHIEFDGEKLILPDTTNRQEIKFNSVERRGSYEAKESDGTVLSYHDLTFKISGGKVTLREDVSLTRMNYNYVFEGTKVSEDPLYEPEGFWD